LAGTSSYAAKLTLDAGVSADVEERLGEPAPDGDLPSTLAFALLVVLPAGSAIGMFELFRVLPRDVPGDAGAFIGLLLAPTALTALISHWACKRCRVETATAWSIVAAASVLAGVFSFAAFVAVVLAYTNWR